MYVLNSTCTYACWKSREESKRLLNVWCLGRPGLLFREEIDAAMLQTAAFRHMQKLEKSYRRPMIGWCRLQWPREAGPIQWREKVDRVDVITDRGRACMFTAHKYRSGLCWDRLTWPIAGVFNFTVSFHETAAWSTGRESFGVYSPPVTLRPPWMREDKRIAIQKCMHSISVLYQVDGEKKPVQYQRCSLRWDTANESIDFRHDFFAVNQPRVV